MRLIGIVSVGQRDGISAKATRARSSLFWAGRVIGASSFSVSLIRRQVAMQGEVLLSQKQTRSSQTRSTLLILATGRTGMRRFAFAIIIVLGGLAVTH